MGRSAADAEAHAQPHASEEVLIRRVIAHQLMTTAGLPITDAQGKRLCGLESGVWDRVLIDLVKREALVPSLNRAHGQLALFEKIDLVAAEIIGADPVQATARVAAEGMDDPEIALAGRGRVIAAHELVVQSLLLCTVAGSTLRTLDGYGVKPERPAGKRLNRSGRRMDSKAQLEPTD